MSEEVIIAGLNSLKDSLESVRGAIAASQLAHEKVSTDLGWVREQVAKNDADIEELKKSITELQTTAKNSSDGMSRVIAIAGVVIAIAAIVIPIAMK